VGNGERAVGDDLCVVPEREGGLAGEQNEQKQTMGQFNYVQSSKFKVQSSKFKVQSSKFKNIKRQK